MWWLNMFKQKWDGSLAGSTRVWSQKLIQVVKKLKIIQLVGAGSDL